MVKCGGCGKFLSSLEAAKCEKCKGAYHRACVGLSPLGTMPISWNCPECKKNIARDNASDTPVRGRDHIQDTCPLSVRELKDDQLSSIIKTELKLIKEEILREVRSEFQILRDEFLDFRSTLVMYGDRLSALEERVTTMETLNNTQFLSETTSENVKDLINQLKCDINDRDQDLLANDIEIANLPEPRNENAIHTVITIATKIGVKLDQHDIVSAERVGGRLVSAADQAESVAMPRPRRLIVRLARRQLRDDMLQNARVRRGITSADLDLPGPPRRFYINERLTKLNRQLFRMARDAGSSYGWRYVWTKRGRIFARKKPDDSVCFIRCEQDIQRIFGTTNFSSSQNSNKKT